MERKETTDMDLFRAQAQPVAGRGWQEEETCKMHEESRWTLPQQEKTLNHARFRIQQKGLQEAKCLGMRLMHR